MRPSPESQLVGLACRVAARRRAEAGAMRALAERVDADTLFEILEAHRLTALAGTRLDELGALPAELRERVALRLRRNRMWGLYYNAAATRVLGALESAGIPALPLKGFALAEAVHGDAGLRRYTDVDVLVAPEHLGAATAAVEPLGFRAPAQPRPGLPELHVCLRDAAERLPPLELHWRVHWFEDGRFSADMLAGSRPAAGGRPRATAPDELAALLLFYARDGFLGLRLAADLSAWWDERGAELAPGGLDALADRHPALRGVWATALTVAARVTGLPAAHALSDLRRGLRGDVAGRLANWPAQGPRSQAIAEVTLVDCLLSPPGQLRAAARRHVFLDAPVLERSYRLPPNARVRRAAWRLLHPAKMLARYARGIVRGLGRPGGPALPA